MLNAVKSVLADVSSVSQSVSQSINQSVNQSIKWLIGVCVMLHTWCLLPNLFKFLLKISTLHTKLYTQNHLGGLINNSYSSYMYLTIPNYLDFLFQTTNIRSNYLNFFWEKEDETSFFFLLIKMSTNDALLPSCDIFLWCRKQIVVVIITVLVTRSLLPSDHLMLDSHVAKCTFGLQ